MTHERCRAVSLRMPPQPCLLLSGHTGAHQFIPKLLMIPMTWEEFIGPYRISGLPFFVQPAGSRKLMAVETEKLASVKTDVGLYEIFNGFYSVHPETNAKAMERRGPVVVAVLLGVIVGAVSLKMVWVHKEHQKQNLTVEMAIALFLKTWDDGTNWRMTPESRKAHKEMPFSESGVGFRKKQYRMMVARGILDPGDATVP